MPTWQDNYPGSEYNTFFQDQVQLHTNTRSRKKQKVHYLNIDSRYRHIENRIETNYIQTNPNFIQPSQGGVILRITNPPQLILTTNNSTSDDNIPATIHVILAWTAPNSQTNPTSIAGLPSSELIYDHNNGGPTWYATLLKYNDHVDEANYRIENLPEKNPDQTEFSQIVGSDVVQLRQVVSIKSGYRLSNHYQISLKNTIRNVVSARIVSSEFPLPFHQPKILAKTTFSSEIDLPELNLSRTINLSPITNNNPDNILHGWGYSVRNHLRDWEIEPFIHRSTTGINTQEVSLLKRILKPKQIVKVYQLPFVGAGSGNPQNQYSDNHRICIDVTGQYDVIEGELLLVILPERTIKGIYRVVDGLEYRFLFQPNVDTWVEPQPGDSIWRNSEFIGWVVSYQGALDNHWMEVTLEAMGNGDDQLQKGDRLHLGNHKLVFQLLDDVCLGPANRVHLDWVAVIPSAEVVPNTPGIYHFEPFQLRHPTHSSLHQAQLRDATSITTNKDTGDTYETVVGTLSTVNEHSLLLIFPTKDLRSTLTGYEIHRIQYPDDARFGLPQSSQSRHPVILVDSPEDDGKTRIYLRDMDAEFAKGQWVTCESECEVSCYHQVDDYDIETRSVVLKTPYQSTRNIHSLKVPKRDMAIKTSNSVQQVRGHLASSASRNDQNIRVYYPSGSYDQFSVHFVVRIGKTIDGRNTTNAEMNVIKGIEPLGDGTIQLTLYFPIVNPHLEGDLVCQTYYYAVLSEYLPMGSKVLEINSDFSLERLGSVRGCLNWLSEMLAVDEDSPSLTDDKFVSEEFIQVERVETVSQNHYRLHLRQPVTHNYPQRDAYLVLFINPDLSPSPPATYNCRHRGLWYTAIELNKNTPLPGSLTSNRVQIYGMRGEDAPIYGLSRSDRVARGIHNLSLDINQEYLSDLLTAPDTRDIVNIAEDIPPQFVSLDSPHFLVVEGRYAGREGSIRCLPKSFQPGVDWRYNQVVAHRDVNNPGMATVQFSKEFIPRRLRGMSHQVTLHLRPRETTGGSPSFQQFPYFYICCPQLPSISLPNGDCDPYTAHQEWSFGSNQELLQGRTKAMVERDQLDQIFAKLQIQRDGSHYSNETIFNTFVDLPKQHMTDYLDETAILEWTFLWPDGQLVDFRGRDHSFTLEIVEEMDDLDMLRPSDV